MLLLFPVFLVLGLFLPGYFLARHYPHPLRWASAFVVSLPVLFHSVFWLGVFHVPITLWTVLPCLMAVAAAAALVPARRTAPAAPAPAAPWSRPDRLLLIASALVGAVLLARSATYPLLGLDSWFRWDFLARKILELGRFDFIPPLTPADFRTYFFVDGIPPMVSFANWWLYASAGRYLPALIAVFVAAQFASTLAFTYGAAAAVHGRRAGVLAAAILAACPLYFRSVVIGQETGLTALAIAAMLYFIVTARRENAAGAMLLAGAAAALCALSREYGWIALVAGITALLWRKHPRRQVLVFAAAATAIAAPWYVRNAILTGNPFYSLRFGDFPVNPVHDAILQHYRSVLGVGHWTADNWDTALALLLASATLPLLAGIPAAFRDFRRQGYAIVIVLLLAAVWLQSAGYTSAGLAVSMRVLSPAMVVLAIMGGPIAESVMRRARWSTAALAVVLLFLVWTAAQGVFFPGETSVLALARLPKTAFRPGAQPSEFQVRDGLAGILPERSRVLSDSAFLHAALAGKGIDVVPVWSPEVRFLFSAPPADAERQLRALGIAYMAVYPRSFNTAYLMSASPFYAALPRRQYPTMQLGDALVFLDLSQH